MFNMVETFIREERNRLDGKSNAKESFKRVWERKETYIILAWKGICKRFIEIIEEQKLSKFVAV